MEIFKDEETKPIKGYEGLYSITNHGRIWSHRGKGRFLKFSKTKKKYLKINLWSSNKIMKTFLVHRLGGITFIENPYNLPEINHKDGIKTNNYIGTSIANYTDGNLEWCTDEYNKKHATENGLTKKHNKKYTKFYGVYYNKGSNPIKKHWFTTISVNKKEIRLGSFKTELEAAKCYNLYVINHSIDRPLNMSKR